ncbi:uncharacterized protein [Venturia canescens]|uniref:uncharacterized protein n=1 Tax=Venturia canescens TaxID=32260 RepID=UPI001C9C7078|nr:uncharacterized protein LOC122416926 [Venturia canescens]
MTSVKYLGLVAFFSIGISGIDGHGRLMDPVNRGSAYRKGFPTPVNWDDDGNYCGGFMVQYQLNNGLCGVCGDNYADKQPRANENGGTYGTGIIVETYKAGSDILANVEITANHFGYFTFDLCPLQNTTDIETEECFDAFKLELADGGFKYVVDTPRVGEYLVKLRLPDGLTCDHCVLRWQYTAGNSWGLCDDGTGAIGCGDQETFRTCSDIEIQ